MIGRLPEPRPVVAAGARGGQCRGPVHDADLGEGRSFLVPPRGLGWSPLADRRRAARRAATALRSPAARHRAEPADRGRVHAADVAVRGSGGRVRREVRRLERLHSSGRDGHRVHPRRSALALRARDQMGLEQGPADRLRVLPRRPVAPERTPPAPATPRPVVSPDGRWEAFVQNHNVAIRAAKSTRPRRRR